ncbi:MAG: pyrimidine 5'-nucleotidase [Hyphomicrobiaceae bacterium]
MSIEDTQIKTERGSFATTNVWIFDLDNTLYPSDCNLFAQVDKRMGSFISERLGVPFAQARHLQKSYYHQFGTTLSGLMQIHKMEPQDFLDYVHDIDLSNVPEHPELAQAIRLLPGRKLIYTNGSKRHGERVAEKLGVLHEFDDICSIETCDYVPKPEREAFDKMTRRFNVSGHRAAMFEDLPHNLEAPHAMGMTTILVHSDYMDHPVQRSMRNWTKSPDHVHHMTDNLCEFLKNETGHCHAK